MQHIWKVVTASLPQWPSGKVSFSRAWDPGILSHFSWLRHTQLYSSGYPARHYWVSVKTGWPVVSILRMHEVASLICIFFLSVTACTTVLAGPSLRYTFHFSWMSTNQEMCFIVLSHVNYCVYTVWLFQELYHLVGQVCKTVRLDWLETGRSGIQFPHGDYSRLSHTKNWRSSGYPARCLAL